MKMDGVGLCANNKQKQNQMLPNKMRGEFSRNQRKDSEVRVRRNCLDLHDCINAVLQAVLTEVLAKTSATFKD